ncbi:conserved hypothetical protein [Leishmania braziliensis MHOM/BR/75/M2904]|uniref:Pentacotripeptide-repeat region of PRORP domain-containing protein n=2 Tax=Leishmania braziliensis TaxID=5660 RepID=A4H8T5_LEIBR|nr:conserved hypothetical protein [Leishmania braziliensis MHOM/BR/75/M2904]KAI5691904.1 hypothetical protein MNV84_02299 [Leishmania braziliensis]CAJ2469843.1 unnamed protein product [Leishmania braziliensis]CAM37801.1 conserved hypothetical protein [Leishmania braziliensis MHOM/BR/75/M2904]SYZ64447.1 hypothetical_protein [Leishmania braziliensis MHOM/BR/75/M2904]
MFFSTGLPRCFASLAVASASRFMQAHLTTETELHPGDRPALWIDDTAPATKTLKEHVQSAAYKELHRPALTTSAMGLFGGEPGFEKAHRVWVDPDRPHMKHVYNQTPLAKNLRYTRYGYFKRDMHLLDIDKLVRHARLLPTPNRLLTDFLYQRVPLPDKSCAAILRYQRDQLTLVADWQRVASFQCAEEIFERMVVTNIPPVDVGPETHAEMIRCCAVCGEWEKGWNVYLQRAREMEVAAAGDTADAFTLTTYLYDAVLELCVACQKPSHGMAILAEVIQRHLRPRPSMLSKTMTLVSMAAEELQRTFPTSSAFASGETAEAESNSSSASPEALSEVSEVPATWEAYTAHGLDTWSLYDFYSLKRSSECVEAYMRMCSMLNMPTLVLEALSFADGAQIRVSLECYQWALYSIRHVPGMGDYIIDVFAQLSQRGLTADYLLFTTAFLVCAKQADGELALAVYEQFYVHSDINPTPEMTLLFIQACTTCEAPTIQMYAGCEAMVQRLEGVGSIVDNILPIYDQCIELAAHVGAVSSAYSRVKKLVSYGKPLTTRILNSLLLANAQSTEGSLSMTFDVTRLYSLLGIPFNDDTLTCLRMCQDAHGTSAEVDSFAAAIEAAQAAAPSGTLGEDAETEIVDTPPHLLRQLKTVWHLRPRDTMLRRFGQHIKPRGREDVGSMLGSTIPFGRSPGERAV